MLNKTQICDFYQRGYLVIKSDLVSSSEDFVSSGLSLEALFESPQTLYHHQSFSNLRQYFYVDEVYPQNTKLLQLYREGINFIHRFLESLLKERGLSQEQIDHLFDHQKSFMRPTHYQAHPVGTILSDEHVDTSLITVLMGASGAGLEIYDGLEQRYVAVDTSPETLVVTAGSIFEAWTDGKVTATRHRVVACYSAERVSFPLFFHPSPEAPMNARFSTFGGYYKMKAKQALLACD